MFKDVICFDNIRKFATHSEDNDFELEFELQSDRIQEKATDCGLLRKVACVEQRSLSLQSWTK